MFLSFVETSFYEVDDESVTSTAQSQREEELQVCGILHCYYCIQNGRIFFPVNGKRLKKTQQYYILLSHPRQERTLGHLVPTLDEIYTSKTLLRKEYKQGEFEIA